MPTHSPLNKTPATCAAIIDRFPTLFGETLGDLDRTVSGVSAPENAKKTEMCFLATPKAFAAGVASEASVLVVSQKMKEQATAQRGDRTVLFSANPEKAMALVISEFFRATPYTNPATQGIHPSAFIGEGAQISKLARVGPNAYVGAHVTIADHAYIGANSVVEDHSTIGESTVIHPLAFIGHSTMIGARCEIHPSAVIAKEGFGYAHDEKFNHTRIPHQGRVVLGDDVHIGAGCTIDRATFGETRIESGVIMDNLVHIAHNNRIGKNSVLTAGFIMAGSSKIGANFVAGGRTVVTGHIEVCDNVQVSALTAISKGISVPGSYGGHPLQPLQDYLRSQAAIAHLPSMQKMLKKIVKQLGLEEEKKT
jgi:UDP-3-O-[3-hydroxymyristoyl] glucosamine N-acyltransferase